MSESNIDLRETHIIGARTREQIVSSGVCPALSLSTIYLTGTSEALPDFRFVRLQPVISQLFACLDGWGYVGVNGQWVRCEAGMVYLTPPGVFHAYYAVEESCWKTCWVIYRQEGDERPAIESACPLLIRADAQDLAHAIQGLYRESVGQAGAGIMYSWAQLVHLYARRIISQSSHEARLHRLWEMVNTDIAYPWNSRELAARAGMSTEHLRRLCQQYNGCSPMRHVTVLRMRHAAVMLSSDAYTVESVAYRVGFENPYAFSTAFKRFWGIAPSLYRSRGQKEIS